MPLPNKNKVIFNVINNNYHYFSYIFSIYSDRLNSNYTIANSINHNYNINNFNNDIIINNLMIKDNNISYNDYFKIFDFNMNLKKQKKYNYYNIYINKSSNIENEFNMLKCYPNIHSYINIKNSKYINNKKINNTLKYYELN